MFYLLYDNRIIDSQKEDVYVYEFQIHKWLHKNNEHKTCFGLLKNQSENVFDLIDWNNDLIRLTFKDGHRLIVYCDINKCEFNNGYYDFEWISAIYKPDGEGNYIKVWERKEE